MHAVIESWHPILNGLLKTLQYSVLGILFAVIVGLIFAMFKLSRFRVLRWISTVYVEIFRGTPLMVQILYIFFGLPAVLPLRAIFGDTYTVIAGTTALALNEGAYITEIIRAGILSINRGQREAAQSIGMNGFLTMRYIILPQAFKRMIPPLVNQFAQTIKDTSLLAAAAVGELIYKGQIVIATNFKAFQIWTAIIILYFIIIFCMSRFASYLERRLQIDKR